MLPENPGAPPAIGKRWPYKALNFLPARRGWSFLRNKSALGLSESSFDLGRSLTECRRILIALPATVRENLVAFPVLRSLMRERSTTDFLFLIDQPLAGLMDALTGSGKVVGLHAGDLFWGEPHFQELRRRTAEFRPDISINLREESPALLHFILRASLAPLRIHAAGTGVPEGFANLFLPPGHPENRLRRYARVAELWNAAERPVPVKWARLTPGPENLKEADALLRREGLDPGDLEIFLWQHGLSRREQEVFRKMAVREGRRWPPLSLSGEGPLFATPAPSPEILAGRPSLSVESTGVLLGLFARARRCVGLNGPLLHLASLADTVVEAHYGEEDRPWDTTWLNAKMSTEYFDSDSTN